MSTDIDYGKLNKRIVFTENDHRHVQFLLKLKELGLTQSKFFRSIITGVISDDDRLFSFMSDHTGLSKKRIAKAKALREEGKQNNIDIGFNQSEIDNLFDLIEEEHPDL